MSQHHLIDNMTFELGLTNSEHAFAQQQACSVFLKQELLPMLEDICSLQVAENQHLVIDRLELDLGRVSQQNWQQALLPIFVDKLSQTLNHALQGGNAASVAGGSHLSRQTSSQSFQTNNQQSINHLTSEQKDWLAVIHFLQNGRLPWYIDNIHSFSPSSVLIEGVGITPQRTDEFRQILSSHISLSRLSQQLGSSSQSKLYQVLSKSNDDWHSGLNALLKGWFELGNKVKLFSKLKQYHSKTLNTLTAALWKVIWQGWRDQYTRKAVLTELIKTLLRHTGFSQSKPELSPEDIDVMINTLISELASQSAITSNNIETALNSVFSDSPKQKNESQRTG